jgi:hypothetical protein
MLVKTVRWSWRGRPSASRRAFLEAIKRLTDDALDAVVRMKTPALSRRCPCAPDSPCAWVSQHRRAGARAWVLNGLGQTPIVRRPLLPASDPGPAFERRLLAGPRAHDGGEGSSFPDSPQAPRVRSLPWRWTPAGFRYTSTPSQGRRTPRRPMEAAAGQCRSQRSLRPGTLWVHHRATPLGAPPPGGQRTPVHTR